MCKVTQIWRTKYLKCKNLLCNLHKTLLFCVVYYLQTLADRVSTDNLALRLTKIIELKSIKKYGMFKANFK